MILYFDFETSYKANMPWMPNACAVLLVAQFQDGRDFTWVINHTDAPFNFRAQQKEIQDVFNQASTIIAHNLKFDLHWLRSCGISVTHCRLYCTMVGEYIATGQRHKYPSLNECCDKYSVPRKMDTVAPYWEQGIETYDIPLEILVPYAKQDLVCLQRVHELQQKIIIAQGQVNLVNIRSESLRVTQEIEWNGMAINRPLLEKYSKDYGETIDTTQQHLKQLIRKELQIPEEVTFNLGSNDHLSAILFGGDIVYKGKEQTQRVLKDGTVKYGTRNAKLTFTTPGFNFTPQKGSENKKEGYYQTNVDQLATLKPKTDEQKELLYGISELAKLEKMKSTYFDGILEAEYCGYVHPTLNECQTATGRYSSKNPNSQNMPREGTSPVKEGFITRY